MLKTDLLALEKLVETWLPGSSGTVKVTGFNSRNIESMRLPGSKSYSNRALILAALSTRSVTLRGIGVCDDTYWVLKSLVDLGFEIEVLKLDDNCLDILIHPLNRIALCSEIYIGKAGTAARFLPALLLNHSHILETEVVAETQLKNRPLLPLLHALKGLGADILIRADKNVCYRQSELRGNTVISGATSGQFLSGLLMAAATARNPISIRRVDELVQPDYVRMTLKILGEFGAKIDYKNLEEFLVSPVSDFGIDSYFVEADASTACYFIAAAALLGQPLTVTNIGSASLQPDVGFSSVLGRFGFSIVVEEDAIRVLKDKRICTENQLSFDMSAMSDQALTVGVLAALYNVDVIVTGVGHTRFHESNRIAGFVSNMLSLEIDAEETSDGFVVFGRRSLGKQLSGLWPCYGDHRFAMSGLLLAIKHSNVVVSDAECVNKTAPQFFRLMSHVGIEFEIA